MPYNEEERVSNSEEEEVSSIRNGLGDELSRLDKAIISVSESFNLLAEKIELVMRDEGDCADSEGREEEEPRTKLSLEIRQKTKRLEKISSFINRISSRVDL